MWRPGFPPNSAGSAVAICRANLSRNEAFTSHHLKMQKDGWVKYIPNFAFK